MVEIHLRVGSSSFTNDTAVDDLVQPFWLLVRFGFCLWLHRALDLRCGRDDRRFGDGFRGGGGGGERRRGGGGERGDARRRGEARALRLLRRRRGIGREMDR